MNHENQNNADAAFSSMSAANQSNFIALFQQQAQAQANSSLMQQLGNDSLLRSIGTNFDTLKEDIVATDAAFTSKLNTVTGAMEKKLEGIDALTNRAIDTTNKGFDTVDKSLDAVNMNVAQIGLLLQMQGQKNDMMFDMLREELNDTQAAFGTATNNLSEGIGSNIVLIAAIGVGGLLVLQQLNKN